jgi:hypothetical protein
MSAQLKPTNKSRVEQAEMPPYRGALSTGFELVAEAAYCQWMNEPFGR